MRESDNDPGFGPGSRTSPQITQPPPSVVSVRSFRSMPSPSPRRLSSSFTRPSELVSRRKMAWVSLEGRLGNAEEASSACAVKGTFSREEAVAWELFTPIQRFLIVSVIGVATAESKKNRLISQLTKSVEFRDQVLSSMQQKLDSLCEQYYVKDQQGITNEKDESAQSEAFGSDIMNFGCWLCDQHHNQLPGFTGIGALKNSSGDEMMRYKVTRAIDTEQEERRMSDLSDWASSSGISTAEIQMNNFSIEQDISNLRKECEGKDTTIKEISSLVQTANVTGSKRISDLEDIILRKNLVITKLKKDVVVLEQKVVQLLRQQRSSSVVSSSTSDSNCWRLPIMVTNVVYDMERTTSPSSSDSDSPPKNRPVAITQKVASAQPVAAEAPVASDPVVANDHPVVASNKPVVSAARFQDTSPGSPAAKFQDSPPRSPVSPRRGGFASRIIGRSKKPHSVSPLRERPANQNSRKMFSLRQTPTPVGGELKKARRRPLSESKDAGPPKRWA